MVKEEIEPDGDEDGDDEIGPDREEDGDVLRPEELVGVDLAIVPTVQEGDQIGLRLRLVERDGRQFDLPIPDRFIDTEVRVIDVGGLADFAGVDPEASPRSAKDGLGALILCDERRRRGTLPVVDQTLKLPVLIPVDIENPFQAPMSGLGIDPTWEVRDMLALGRWTSADEVPEAVLSSAVERPPPLPEVGDTDAWPDTVEEWLADIDARLRHDPDMTAVDYRALYMGFDFDLEDFGDPLDPALEEALRIREVPGALPPPEPPEPGPGSDGPGSAADRAALPIIPMDNRVCIVDRPDFDDLRVPFAGDADAVRRMWEDLVAVQRYVNPPERSGCIGGWLIATAITGMVVLILLLLLFVGVFDGDDEDEAANPSPPNGEDGGDEVGVVPVGEYADEVCRNLEANVSAGVEAFGAALADSQNTQPATPEEFQQLYDGLVSGAAQFAAGLDAAAAQLADGPVPDVEDGEGANQSAVDTYEQAAGAAQQISDLAGGISPDSSAEELADFGVAVNESLAELDLLGTEYKNHPVIDEAIDESEVCAEIEAAGG